MPIKKLDVPAVLKVGSYASEQTILRIDTPPKYRRYDYTGQSIAEICENTAFALAEFGMNEIAVVAWGMGLAVIDCLSAKGIDVTEINI